VCLAAQPIAALTDAVSPRRDPRANFVRQCTHLARRPLINALISAPLALQAPEKNKKSIFNNNVWILARLLQSVM